MEIERRPLQIHKGLVIRLLREQPDQLADTMPGGEFATAAEAIAWLEAQPGEWIIDGVLEGTDTVVS